MRTNILKQVLRIEHVLAKYCDRTNAAFYETQCYTDRRELPRSAPGTVSVYLLFNECGPFYIGLSNYPKRRLEQHAAKDWMREEELSFILVRAFQSQETAETAEKVLIAHLQPSRNVLSKKAKGDDIDDQMRRIAHQNWSAKYDPIGLYEFRRL
jgi:predicted GIY-YIG superfamily endonuclease